MELRRFSNIQAFWQESQLYLRQHEAEHCLILGILNTLLDYPNRYPDPPYLAIVKISNQIAAAALRTSPYKLVLSKAQDLDAVRLLAQDFRDCPTQLPGVSGLASEVEAFLKAWQSLTTLAPDSVMNLKIHQLTQVAPIATAKGYLRSATEGDRPLLLDWFAAFDAEVGGVMGQDTERAVDTALKRGGLHLWIHEVPVSLAGGNHYLTTLPTAARIGPVYTPLVYRQKGYATACVAELSQKLLAKGCHRCFLFTDLANPTSNHIYQAIGYHPICEWFDYAFGAKENGDRL